MSRRLGDILQEAHETLNGDRAEEYGDPAENFARAATIASELLGRVIRPADVAAVMVAVKLGRAARKPKRDTLVDAAAYLSIWYHLTPS